MALSSQAEYPVQIQTLVLKEKRGFRRTHTASTSSSKNTWKGDNDPGTRVPDPWMDPILIQ
eukprot:244258-Rhodomonas_salina.1